MEFFSAACLASFEPFVRLCFFSVSGFYSCLFFRLCHPWSDSFPFDIYRFAIIVARGVTSYCDHIVTVFLRL